MPFKSMGFCNIGVYHGQTSWLVNQSVIVLLPGMAEAQHHLPTEYICGYPPTNV